MEFKLNKYLNLTRKLLFPDACCVCHSEHTGDIGICLTCLNSLPHRQTCCPICAGTSETGDPCGSCLKQSPGYDSTVCLFDYVYPIDQLIHQLKFRAKLPLARIFGGMMAATLENMAPEQKPQVLLPVPLHHWRLRRRGFNQTQELAKFISAKTDIPVLSDAVRRSLNSPPQHSLPRNKRIRNLRNAFATTQPLPYKRIALVDDVMTTGATLEALARLVRKSGPEHVQNLVIARVCQNT